MDETRNNPIDEFIKQLGSTSKVAAALGVRPSVVSTWRVKGRVPYWRRGPLLELAFRKGVPIPAELAQ